MKAAIEDTIALTRNITHSYYDGDMEPWLSRLCPKSIWIGTGDRLLIGDNAIRAYFQRAVHRLPCKIYQEEYFTLPLAPRCSAVVAQLTVGDFGQERGEASAMNTFIYQLVGTETKLVLLQTNYKFCHPSSHDDTDSMMELSAYQFVRDLLLDVREEKRISIPCGNTSLFVQPHMILYVQSKNRRAELSCVDKVIQTSLSISEVNALLPEDFCSIHRCYTVNTRYVMSIRRYEVSLITGETLPIPFHSYMQVKSDLEHRISGWKKSPD